MTFNLRRTHQIGFTLIELVTVIVILGVLAVSSLPLFIDLSDDAHKVTAKSHMAAFRAGAQQLNMKWRASGQPLTIASPEGAISMSLDGWPKGATSDTQGCIDLWNNILEDAPSISSVFTLNEDWSTFGNSIVCLYFNNRKEALNGATNPFFFYYHTSQNSATAGTFQLSNVD